MDKFSRDAASKTVFYINNFMSIHALRKFCTVQSLYTYSLKINKRGYSKFHSQCARKCFALGEAQETAAGICGNFFFFACSACCGGRSMLAQRNYGNRKSFKKPLNIRQIENTPHTIPQSSKMSVDFRCPLRKQLPSKSP